MLRSGRLRQHGARQNSPEAKQSCVGSTAVVNAAKWQAAAAWREAKQSFVENTAVVNAAKWQAAIK